MFHFCLPEGKFSLIVFPYHQNGFSWNRVYKCHGFVFQAVCFAPANHLNASHPVSLEVCAGKRLNISLSGFTENNVCGWIRENVTLVTVYVNFVLIYLFLRANDQDHMDN